MKTAPQTGEARPYTGRRIRMLRRARGLSLRDLARAAGVDRGALSRVETGKRPVTPGLLFKIAEPLRLTDVAVLDRLMFQESDDA